MNNRAFPATTRATLSAIWHLNQAGKRADMRTLLAKLREVEPELNEWAYYARISYLKKRGLIVESPFSVNGQPCVSLRLTDAYRSKTLLKDFAAHRFSARPGVSVDHVVVKSIRL